VLWKELKAARHFIPAAATAQPPPRQFPALPRQFPQCRGSRGIFSGPDVVCGLWNLARTPYLVDIEKYCTLSCILNDTWQVVFDLIHARNSLVWGSFVGVMNGAYMLCGHLRGVFFSVLFY
jgi:hypothetical protein